MLTPELRDRAAIVARLLTEALKEGLRQTGTDPSEAVAFAFGWACRLKLDESGWSAEQAGAAAQTITQGQIELDRRGAS